MNEEPLSERTGRYRRNVILLAFVLTLIGFLEHLDFSNVGFFGVRLDASETKPEIIIIGTIALVFAFQSLMFWVYAIREYMHWRFKFSSQVPYLRSLYGFRYPAKKLEEFKKSWDVVEVLEGNNTKKSSNIYEIILKKNKAHSSSTSMHLDNEYAGRIRSNIHFYVSVDLLIPAVMTILAIYAIVRRLW